jgi:hypothetical protein
MQHVGLVWKKHMAVIVATGLAALPMLAHAEMDSMTRVERTPAYDVALTIGPPQGMASMSLHAGNAANMATDHDMSMGGGPNMGMQAHQDDQGMAVNHWVDVHITQAGSAAVVSDVMPIIRIVDKSTGEAHDLAGVMGVNGGMSSDDVRFGQNAFLPDGTYQITVLLGPTDTAQFRDVAVTTSAMMSEPGKSQAMGAGDGTNMADEPATHP